MARSVNKIILVGNVGRDPEVQTVPVPGGRPGGPREGEKVAHFSLATSRRIPRENGFEERTEWHRITVYDRLADLAEEYIRKGDRLYIEGRMEYGSYARDGNTIPTSGVVVRELVMLGSASGRSGGIQRDGSWEVHSNPPEPAEDVMVAMEEFLAFVAKNMSGTPMGDRAAELRDALNEAGVGDVDGPKWTDAAALREAAQGLADAER